MLWLICLIGRRDRWSDWIRLTRRLRFKAGYCWSCILIIDCCHSKWPGGLSFAGCCCHCSPDCIYPHSWYHLWAEGEENGILGEMDRLLVGSWLRRIRSDCPVRTRSQNTVVVWIMQETPCGVMTSMAAWTWSSGFKSLLNLGSATLSELLRGLNGMKDVMLADGEMDA